MNTNTSEEEYSTPTIAMLGSLADITLVRRGEGSMDWQQPL